MALKVIFSALFATLVTASSVPAAEKCYKDVWVEAKMECGTSNSKSADFTTGCKNVVAHWDKEEIECEVGRWVNVIAETKFGSSGKAITHRQACAVYGLQPFSINGSICASGERWAQQGNGWETINYKYGKKGDGNGLDGGDKLESFSVTGGSNPDDFDYGHPTETGTMCYDISMGKKNNTKQDAAIAVYCK